MSAAITKGQFDLLLASLLGRSPQNQRVSPIQQCSYTKTEQPRKEPPIGGLSSKYETSGRGPGTVSTGKGDIGGASYGSYQLASKLGRPQEFLAKEGKTWARQFGAAAPGTEAFNNIWKEIAAREPAAFHGAQHDFIKRTHFDVQLAHIKKTTGVDLSNSSPAVKDAIWSTSVQHGPNSHVVSKALVKTMPSTNHSIDERKLIKAIYAERGSVNVDGKLTYFSKNSAAVQDGVAARFKAEERDALKMLDDWNSAL